MLDVILKNFGEVMHMINQGPNRIGSALVAAGLLSMTDLKLPCRAAREDFERDPTASQLLLSQPTTTQPVVRVDEAVQNTPTRHRYDNSSETNPVTRQLLDFQQLPNERKMSLAASLAITIYGYAATTRKWLARTQTPSLSMGVTWTLTNAAVLAGALFDASPAGAVRPSVVVVGCASLLVSAICRQGRTVFSVWDWAATGLSISCLGGFLLSKFSVLESSAGVFSAGTALVWGTVAGIIGSIPKLRELYLSPPPPLGDSFRTAYRSIGGAAIPMGLVSLALCLNAWTLWDKASPAMKFATTSSALDVAAIAAGESYRRWRQLKQK